MSNVHRLLPRLRVNGRFIQDFIAAEPPCFALGLVEERKQRCGFLALRPDEAIPPTVCAAGFNFGHSLLGNAAFEVIHFAFEFYGFETYNVLANPNNPMVQTVLSTMIESGDYFFFAISANGNATAFRSEIGQANLAGLKAHLPRVQNSTTTDAQYRQSLSQFAKSPLPAGRLLNWVCRDDVDYLDLTRECLDLSPA